MGNRGTCIQNPLNNLLCNCNCSLVYIYMCNLSVDDGLGDFFEFQLAAEPQHWDLQAASDVRLRFEIRATACPWFQKYWWWNLVFLGLLDVVGFDEENLDLELVTHTSPPSSQQGKQFVTSNPRSMVGTSRTWRLIIFQWWCWESVRSQRQGAKPQTNIGQNGAPVGLWTRNFIHNEHSPKRPGHK